MPAIRALRPGDPLENGRADPGAKAVSGIAVLHLPIIGGAEKSPGGRRREQAAGAGRIESWQSIIRSTAACTAFFELPAAAKMEIAMARGGPAWRGYFPVGAELTSGQPDLKEGLYFGAELGDEDPRVRAGLPLHGRNLFPRQVPALRDAVLAYIDALTALGQAVLRGVALSLGLEADYFAAGYTARPTPHRVRNASGRDRLSFPFFFDPGFSAEIPRCRGGPRSPKAASRAGTARTCTRSPASTATTC